MNLLEAKQELREHGYTLIKEGLFGYDMDKVKAKAEQALNVCKTETKHFKGSSFDGVIFPLMHLAQNLKFLLKQLEKEDDKSNIKFFLKQDDNNAFLYCTDDSRFDEIHKMFQAEKIDMEKANELRGKTKSIKLARFKKEIGPMLEEIGIVPLYKKIKELEPGEKFKEYDMEVIIPLDVSGLFKGM